MVDVSTNPLPGICRLPPCWARPKKLPGGQVNAPRPISASNSRNSFVFFAAEGWRQDEGYRLDQDSSFSDGTLSGCRSTEWLPPVPASPNTVRIHCAASSFAATRSDPNTRLETVDAQALAVWSCCSSVSLILQAAALYLQFSGWKPPSTTRPNSAKRQSSKTSTRSNSLVWTKSGTLVLLCVDGRF